MNVQEIEALRIGLIAGVLCGGLVVGIVTYLLTRKPEKPMATRHSRHFFAN